MFLGWVTTGLCRHTGGERHVLPPMYWSAATVMYCVLQISLENKDNERKGPNWTSESSASELLPAIYKFMRI